MNTRLAAVLAQLPYFVLSGTCLFAGCYLISAAAHQRVDELGPVLMTVAATLVYQSLIGGIAWWLVRRPDHTAQARRQGAILVGIGVLLAADRTLLLAEVTVAVPELGAALAGLAIVLGLVTVAAFLHRLRVPHLRRLTGVVATLLLCTHGVTLAGRLLNEGGFLPTGFHANVAWLAVGACVAAAPELRRWWNNRWAAENTRFLGPLLALALPVLLMVHVGALGITYGGQAAEAVALPLLLCGPLMAMAARTHVAGLCVLGLLWGLMFLLLGTRPPTLAPSMAPSGWVLGAVLATPLLIAAVRCGGVLRMALGTAAAGVVASLGWASTWFGVFRWGTAAFRPPTLMEAGVAGVVLAFALLALGVWVQRGVGASNQRGEVVGPEG